MGENTANALLNFQPPWRQFHTVLTSGATLPCPDPTCDGLVEAGTGLDIRTAPPRRRSRTNGDSTGLSGSIWPHAAPDWRGASPTASDAGTGSDSLRPPFRLLPTANGDSAGSSPCNFAFPAPRHLALSAFEPRLPALKLPIPPPTQPKRRFPRFILRFAVSPASFPPPLPILRSPRRPPWFAPASSRYCKLHRSASQAITGFSCQGTDRKSGRCAHSVVTRAPQASDQDWLISLVH